MLLLGVLALAFFAYRTVDRLVFGGDAPPPGPRVRVVIPQGASVGQIGDRLDAADVVSNGQAWALRVRLSGDGGGLQAGTYRLRQHEDYDRLIAQLRAGPPRRASAPVARLAIPEGLRISQIALRARRAGVSPAAYRRAVAKAAPPAGYHPTGREKVTMEGFLFPATYDLRRPVSADRLVGEQLQAFARAQSGIDFRYAAKRKLTRYDVLIIASLIEREAANPADRPKIAAVIYNRLHAGMSLGIDATIQYAVGSWRPPTAADLKIDSPYNSRTHVGLPPTPISNPGLASLRAAAHPAKVPYLYYVAIPGDRKRRHFFTTSLAAFNRFQAEHPPK